MTTIVVSPASANTNALSTMIAAPESSTGVPTGGRMPPAIGEGQAYYWSRAWQRDQQESIAELIAGNGVSFDNAEEAIRWLLSSD